MAKSNDKSPEIVRVGIIRARTCESAALQCSPGQENSAFLAGLLSVLPGILDRPMESILKHLPVAKEIHDALLPPSDKKEGVLQIILRATQLVEAGKWHDTTKECYKIGLSYASLCGFHKDAISWAQRYDASKE